MAKVCAYPECDTVLSRYNDGQCCSEHESYNRMQRAGLTYAKVSEQSPAMEYRGKKTRKKTKG